MKTIVYGKRNGIYECIKITEDSDESTRVVFEEPIDGKLVLGKYLFTVVSGICDADISSLPDGEYSPILFLGEKPSRLEELRVFCGRVSRRLVDDEYIRRLSGVCEELSKRILSLEKITASISDKFNETIKL